MKKILLTLFIGLSLLPSIVFAECKIEGFTVIYINGIFTNENEARRDLIKLNDAYEQKYKNSDTDFILGHNESHIGGVDDLFVGALQVYGGESMDIDLQTILINVHSQLKTRKVLLVGHSQGTFYTNEAYNYLIGHGVNNNSIAVYNIASPASYVAGGGTYLNSSTDKVINGVGKNPLVPNINIPLTKAEDEDPFGGHSLSDVYLAKASDKIVSDIHTALEKLTVGANIVSDCFTPPKADYEYQDMKMKVEYLDLVTKGLVWAFNTAEAIGRTVFEASKTVVLDLSKIITHTLWGASLVDSVTPVDSVEMISETLQTNISSNPVAVKSSQDILDDIADQLDVITRQVQDLMIVQKPTTLVSESKELNEEVLPQSVEDSIDLASPYSKSGGKDYPKLLISEIQVGGVSDAKQEFIELYNPNSVLVDLTGWYLQRKTAGSTSWASYASSTLFNGKRIGVNGYFLIARSGFYGGLADIVTNTSITEDNSFTLKNPAGEIVDKVGFGNAKDPELLSTVNPSAGQTIGRKVLVDGSEEETDNNLNDFELQSPTPRLVNMAYVPVSSTPTDILAPEVIFTVDSFQSALSFPISFTLTDIAGTVSPSGLSSYMFRWQENGGTWQEDSSALVVGAPTSQTLLRNFDGVDGKTYNFQVKAVDIYGNESDWIPETPTSVTVDIAKQILINEIQIAGITTKDEFIELYNAGSVAVDLTGYSLKKKNSGGIESNLVSAGSFTGIIGPHEYFLIAPPDNSDSTVNYTGSASPDLRYSGSSFSIASNNTVLLYNNHDVLLDKVGYGTAVDFETLATVSPDTVKSIERKIIGQDSNNNFNDFRISDIPTPKASFMNVSFQDVTDYTTSFGAQGNNPLYYIFLEWGSTTANIDSYQIQYRVNNGAWVDWLHQTTDISGIFNAYFSEFETETMYEFRAQSKDILGNVSDWKVLSTDISMPVVINEVAFYGTDSSVNDQWIELYNKTNQTVDLTGWKIASGSLNIPLAGNILPNGYFLLEQSDDNTISDISADQIFSGDLSKSSMKLFNSNNHYVDELVSAFPYYTEADILQNSHYHSIERVSVNSFGTSKYNWKINDEILVNGTDRNLGAIYGTPKAQNSVHQLYTFINHDFYRDTILSSSLSPYLFSETPRVQEGVTLTIEPGSVIKFHNDTSSLWVLGTLLSVGTDNNKIVFTSLSDDEYAGDTNSDDTATTGSAGQWLGIKFTESSQNSDLEHVVIRYAGATQGSSPVQWGRALWLDKTTITLKNSTLENNAVTVLYLTDANIIIDNVYFINNNTSLSGITPRVIYMQWGSLEIKNSTFQGNGTLLITESTTDLVTGEVINPIINLHDIDPDDPEQNTFL